MLEVKCADSCTDVGITWLEMGPQAHLGHQSHPCFKKMAHLHKSKRLRDLSLIRASLFFLCSLLCRMFLNLDTLIISGEGQLVSSLFICSETSEHASLYKPDSNQTELYTVPRGACSDAVECEPARRA